MLKHHAPKEMTKEMSSAFIEDAAMSFNLTSETVRWHENATDAPDRVAFQAREKNTVIRLENLEKKKDDHNGHNISLMNALDTLKVDLAKENAKLKLMKQNEQQEEKEKADAKSNADIACKKAFSGLLKHSSLTMCNQAKNIPHLVDLLRNKHQKEFAVLSKKDCRLFGVKFSQAINNNNLFNEKNWLYKGFGLCKNIVAPSKDKNHYFFDAIPRGSDKTDNYTIADKQNLYSDLARLTDSILNPKPGT